MANTKSKIFIRENLGATIKKYRLMHGISVEDLAKMLNLSVAFVGLIERGFRGVNLKNLVRISEIFDMDINDLLYDTDSTPIVESPEMKKIRALTALATDLSEKELDFAIESIKCLKKMRD